MPGNSILYSELASTNTTYRYMSPDGSNDTQILSVTANYDAIAPHPSQVQFVFAYSTNPSATNPTWGIFTNTTVNIAGATRLTPSNMSEVASTQFTPDGSQVVFVGAIGTGDFNLYRVNSDGTGLTGSLDVADLSGAHISPDGTKIVYAKLFGSAADIVWRNLSAGPGAGTFLMGQLPNISPNVGPNDGDDFAPQWSKDGTKIAFISDRFPSNDPDAQYEIHTRNFSTSPTATGPTRLTNSMTDFKLGVSWSPDGSELACVVFSTVFANTGIYRLAATGGSLIPIKQSPQIGNSLFWTPDDTRSFGQGNSVGYSKRARQFRRRR